MDWSVFQSKIQIATYASCILVMTWKNSIEGKRGYVSLLYFLFRIYRDSPIRKKISSCIRTIYNLQKSHKKLNKKKHTKIVHKIGQKSTQKSYKKIHNSHLYKYFFFCIRLPIYTWWWYILCSIAKPTISKRLKYILHN